VKLRKGHKRKYLEKIETTIVALDWDPEEDVMLVNTRNKTYVNKGKGGNPKTTFSPSSSSQDTTLGLS
jgi:hypothetical protein